MVNGRKEKRKEKKLSSKRASKVFRAVQRAKSSLGLQSRLPARHSAVETRRLRLVLLRGSLLGGLLGLGLGGRLTIGTLVLHVLIIDVESLIDLSAEGLFVIQTIRQELVCVFPTIRGAKGKY